MDHSVTPSVTSGIITSSSTIITSTPSISNKSVIVDPSSSDENKTVISALVYPSTSSATEPHHTPKRVSSSTVSSPILTPPTGKIFSRNCNGTSE
jgi:hypothetical protein